MAFADLLVAARAGDGRACRMLYEQGAGEVLGFLRARGTPEPEEVVNDVFVAAFSGLSGFSGDEAAFRAWVFQIARFKRVDALRRLERRAGGLDPGRVPETAPGGDVESEAIARLDDDALRAVLDPLTPDQRDVLLLRLIGELSLAQIAEVLGKPVGAVKALQHRALAQLRERLQPLS